MSSRWSYGRLGKKARTPYDDPWKSEGEGGRNESELVSYNLSTTSKSPGRERCRNCKSLYNHICTRSSSRLPCASVLGQATSFDTDVREHMRHNRPLLKGGAVVTCTRGVFRPNTRPTCQSGRTASSEAVRYSLRYLLRCSWEDRGDRPSS